MPSIQVPATVLAARIDRLPLEEKRRLQTAAVIGTDMPFALLRAIADVPEGTLHRGLRRFSGHGLTRVRTALALEVLGHHLLVLHRCSRQKDHGPQTPSTTAKSAASNRTLC